jgi:hypothetical protein
VSDDSIVCCPITAITGKEDDTITSSTNNWDVVVVISRIKDGYKREIRL